MESTGKQTKIIDKSNCFVFLKGAVIGGTMLVPGVSGGSMAMILGIYNRLIGAVSSFLKDVKGNILFMIIFVAGAGVGMIGLSHPISFLMENYTKPFMYFFLGAVAGSVPLVYRHARTEDKGWKSRLKQLAYLVLGMVVVMIFAFIPQDTFTGGGVNTSGNIAIQLLAGVIAAVALVLPGISVSYMLVLMGIYDSTVAAISRLDIFYLMPIGLGLFLGIVLVTKLLETAMNRHPEPTYLIILGFMIGSIAQVFPGMPHGIVEWLLCANLAVGGFGAILGISSADMSELG